MSSKWLNLAKIETSGVYFNTLGSAISISAFHYI